MAAAKRRTSARRVITCRSCGMRTGPLARSTHPELCVQCFVDARRRQARSGYQEAAAWVLQDKAESTEKARKKVAKKKAKPKPKPKPTGPQTRFDREDVI